METNIALKKTFYCLLFLTLSGCGINHNLSTSRTSGLRYKDLSATDRKLADTLIKNALDNEGLYTVISGLKPISTVGDLSLMIARKDSLINGTRKVTDTNSTDYKKLVQYHRIVKALQFGDLKFVISPFNMHESGKRMMQINIYRQSLLDSLVNANPEFYGQFGYVPGTDGALLINTTEYEKKFERFRSYGYLFGYPEHAISFFVDAGITEEEKKEFVTRDFYQIPVFNGATGHFVYALPKNSNPLPVDAVIKAKAIYALGEYKKARTIFLRKDGSLRAYELLLYLMKKPISL